MPGIYISSVYEVLVINMMHINTAGALTDLKHILGLYCRTLFTNRKVPFNTGMSHWLAMCVRGSCRKRFTVLMLQNEFQYRSYQLMYSSNNA